MLLRRAPERRTSAPCIEVAIRLIAAGWLVVLAVAMPLQAAQEVPSIKDKTKGMERQQGFFDLYWDEAEGKLYLEIDRWDNEFLYQVSLSTGLGSNPVGLDRGQLGDTYILKAQRVGPTVLLIQPNYRYRAPPNVQLAKPEAVHEQQNAKSWR